MLKTLESLIAGLPPAHLPAFLRQALPILEGARGFESQAAFVRKALESGDSSKAQGALDVFYYTAKDPVSREWQRFLRSPLTGARYRNAFYLLAPHAFQIARALGYEVPEQEPSHESLAKIRERRPLFVPYPLPLSGAFSDERFLFTLTPAGGTMILREGKSDGKQGITGFRFLFAPNHNFETLFPRMNPNDYFAINRYLEVKGQNGNRQIEEMIEGWTSGTLDIGWPLMTRYCQKLFNVVRGVRKVTRRKDGKIMLIVKDGAYRKLPDHLRLLKPRAIARREPNDLIVVIHSEKPFSEIQVSEIDLASQVLEKKPNAAVVVMQGPNPIRVLFTQDGARKNLSSDLLRSILLILERLYGKKGYLDAASVPQSDFVDPSQQIHLVPRVPVEKSQAPEEADVDIPITVEEPEESAEIELELEMIADAPDEMLPERPSEVHGEIDLSEKP
jgi:hypothetical protein